MSKPAIAILGGGGRTGLPLALLFAARGLHITIVDADQARCELIQSGRVPFHEPGIEMLLNSTLSSGCLLATSDIKAIANAHAVIVTINSEGEFITRLGPMLNYMCNNQLLVIRSTVMPGTTRHIERIASIHGLTIDIAFCPERAAEGAALKELRQLPQIISATTPIARKRAIQLFKHITKRYIELELEEAEFGKLVCNTWRYITFAAANQFSAVASAYGLDFEKVREAISDDYPRAAGIPTAGFSAGPCLPKDTQQFIAYSRGKGLIAQAAIRINEDLPLQVVNHLKARFSLKDMIIGILGMAFKADSDDSRNSLSYDLRCALEGEANDVLCTDPHVVDKTLVSLQDILKQADILIIAVSHRKYRNLKATVPVIDVTKGLPPL